MAAILLVDDSTTVRKLLIRILKPAGFDILEAGDGIQALEVMAQEHVDLVVADLNMPHMDGIELVKMIRKQPEHADLPIVMLTTESDSEHRRKGLEAGANVYLVKPAPSHMILYKIQSLLGGK